MCVDGLTAYLSAFEVIDRDPSELLVVAVLDDEVGGTMQLSVLPGLSRRAMTRLQVEGVRVAQSQRGSGLGGRLVRWAIAEAEARGCGLVQLTSDLRVSGAMWAAAAGGPA